MIISTICIVLTTSILFLYIYIHYKRNKYSHFKTSPFLPPVYYHYLPGHLTLVKRLFRQNRAYTLSNIIEILLQELNTKTMVLFYAYRVRVFTKDHALVAVIFGDHARFKKSKQLNRLLSTIAGVRMLGRHSVINLPGHEIWHTKRKILQVAFHRKNLKKTFGGMLPIVNKWVGYTQEKGMEADETPLDMFSLYTKITYEIISSVGFLMDEDVIDTKTCDVKHTINLIFKTMGLFFKNSFTFNLPWKFQKEKRTMREELLSVRGHLLKYIQDKLNDKIGKGTLLSAILQANSFDPSFTLENVVDELLTFYIAAMETTSITLTFFTYFLLKHPEVYDKVKYEVDTVLADKEELRFADLSELGYTEQVLKESMRLLPAVDINNKEAQCDVVAHGLRIPKGTIVQVSTQLVQQDPASWPDPSLFDPDRFAPGTTIRPYTYLPFMAGARCCLGKRLAMMEMKVIIAKLLYNFDLVDPYPEREGVQTVSVVTTRPRHGLPVVVRNRLRQSRSSCYLRCI